jgi:beta-ribofuranosylaminobenzene 5'-phosphate synthase
MTDRVTITTGARLHFGPLFCGRTSGRRFGGVGVMIDRPGCQVTVCRAECDELIVPEEVRSLAEQCIAGARGTTTNSVPIRIEMHESILRHRGLGSGTQTALAIAQGIYVLHHGEPADAGKLAVMTGRGLRSAVGIHGFDQGGFLIDAGKRDPDAIGALAARCDIPPDWRFVLIAPRNAAGLSGRRERDAFAKLPAMRAATSAELCRIALTELLPAIREADFPAFADGLFEYGRIVGEFFSPVQGGCFAGPEAARLAATLRAAGFAGVAQSSWGPTVAVVASSEGEARQVANEVANDFDRSCIIARPSNCGASVTVG